MQTKLTFLGAAQNVTGSRYVVETNGLRLLVDCGLYQERELRARNWEPFATPPNTLDAVLLTHAHLDHCGLLPKLVREGFEGRVYCTAATSEIAQIVLLDAARIQEEDAEFKRRRHKREGRKGRYPEMPLYTEDDAKHCLPLFTTLSYQQPLEIADGIEVTYHDAGHILGSSMIRLKLNHNGNPRTIVFSGDVGRWGKPILRDPTLFEEADYVVVESTYGDRVHSDMGRIDDTLAEVVNTAEQAGGKIIIPSFAVERSQEVLYRLNTLLREDRIPRVATLVDSPMAVSVTQVFQHHPDLLDEETTDLIRRGASPFDFPGLKMVRTVEESKAINRMTGTVVIIAGSGMCTGGRVKHHLAHQISGVENTILFVGYQAAGTLGRQITDGKREVRILGQVRPVNARVLQIHGFSAHADKDELSRWLSGLKNPPRRLFVTHGEPDSARRFADFVAVRAGWDTTVPSYQDVAVLE